MSSSESGSSDGEEALPGYRRPRPKEVVIVRRENQITFCRELITKHGCDNWESFLASMTPGDRMNLYLTGLNTYAVLKREFSGMVNDARRAKEDARLEERAKHLAAALVPCSVVLDRNLQ